MFFFNVLWGCALGSPPKKTNFLHPPFHSCLHSCIFLAPVHGKILWSIKCHLMMISTVMATTTANMANQNPTVNLLLQIHLMTLHHGHEPRLTLGA